MPNSAGETFTKRKLSAAEPVLFMAEAEAVVESCRVLPRGRRPAWGSGPALGYILNVGRAGVWRIQELPSS